MAKCEICGKTAQTGNNVSHSKRHTKRKWAPNVHSANLVVNGRKTRLKICMRCLRTRQKISR
jgi:large subunit ribosomal protein L28